MKTTTTSREPLPETFDELHALHALRPIKDDVDYENAVELVDRLAVLAAPTEDQADYLATLTELVAKYDEEHFALDIAHLSGLDTLKYLVESHAMTASQLGELLGNRSLGSKLLRGERELSKRHLRILADHFKVDASVLL
jgi:HTH-type transcriptional regulator/antitoxin HigA